MLARLSLILLSLAGVSSIAGCGDGLVKVQGEVFLDEKPLPNADIALIPQEGGRLVSGKSDAQGKFALTTTKPGDGVKPGTYKVSVTAREVKFAAKAGEVEGFVENHVWLAPEKYSNAETSGLVVAIQPSDPALQLKLKSEAK
jgi:hypothetical protein